MGRAAILTRLDAGLEKMATRKMEVRAIYLTEDDWDALNDALGKAWGCPLVTFQYQGHQIRSGEHSRIYSDHGVAVDVPRPRRGRRRKVAA
ncbi:MAG: hypothetical protein DMF06_05055 [Verrucomicrobia bacterium]|nr:MAG: hypothetical protein DMF06_05055 [Verrucomicrobiota bacterium]